MQSQIAAGIFDVCQMGLLLVYWQKTVKQQINCYFNSSIENTMINPRQVVHFHLDHKPRHANPTYNSSSVFDSLNAFGNTDYTKTLLKETEYKDHFASNRRSSIVPSFNYSRRAGPQQIPQNAQKQNCNDKMSRSYLSTHGANLLLK